MLKKDLAADSRTYEIKAITSEDMDLINRKKYQLCFHLTWYSDHNIVTTSLETLQHVLRKAPSLLVYMLTSEQGLGGEQAELGPGPGPS